jgi:hypothetical protein
MKLDRDGPMSSSAVPLQQKQTDLLEAHIKSKKNQETNRSTD